MSENTKIEWADHTFNPWTGCRRVSPGCLHCYMFAFLKRFGRDATERRRTSAATWRNPLKWNREAAGMRHHGGECPRVFPSFCDWLDDEVPIEWLADFLKLIHDTPNLDWLLLTKRPENWRERLCAVMEQADDAWLRGSVEKRSPFGVWLGGWLEAASPHRGMSATPANIWIGTSVEDQHRADERIPHLLNIPAMVRFLSVEPMLELIDISGHLWKSGCMPHCGDKCSKDADCPLEPATEIHWVIVGGESGPGARKCNVGWISDLVQQCSAVGVPCFVKQFGAFCVTNESTPDGWPAGTVLKQNPACTNESLVKLKHPKGGDPAEWPKDIRVRQFPI